jgi:hypothetical protein
MRVAEREKLPNRREATTFDVEAGGLRYRATIGRYGDGRLAEIFIDMSKVGSDADAAARDCAIATSLARPCVETHAGKQWVRSGFYSIGLRRGET